MTYPQQPGWRSGPHSATSRDAAVSVRAKAPTMLALIERLLEDGPASPEQLHAKLVRDGERSLLTSVRARVCQLHKLGRVVDSGKRGLGESARAKVIIWRLSSPEERSRFNALKALADEKGPNNV